MSIHHESYQALKKWKDEQILNHSFDTNSLNHFHDHVLNAVYNLSLHFVINKIGTPPCKFTWFAMGSAGRFEQGIISDQDHGIIYEESSEECNAYFHVLGKEIAYGLNEAGYPYCEGNVMSSNSKWCKSVDNWLTQITGWLEKESYESIRYLQIFYDARMLAGDENFVVYLKEFIHDYCKDHPEILLRFLDNVKRIKQVIGLFGQFFVESSGPFKGCINLKDVGYLPYVNAIRILAMKEGISETSTISRFNSLRKIIPYCEKLPSYENHFRKLLDYRISFLEIQSYDSLHYVNIHKLAKSDKRELKEILKDGISLHHYVQAIIRKGVKNGL